MRGGRDAGRQATVAVSRLRLRDSLGTAVTGLRARRLRAALTAGGVAIGIAAMVAVLGVSTSGRVDLLAALDALGTDLLVLTPGRSFLGTETALPTSAPGAVRRVAQVQQASATASLEATVRRTDRVPALQTGGIRAVATELSLLDTLRGEMAAGRFLDRATAEQPAVVLGATTARRLGIDGVEDQPLVWLGEQWFGVVGILAPLPLAPEIDSWALIGFAAAERVRPVAAPTEVALTPTSIYVRTGPQAVDDVRELLPRSANPDAPEAVAVSRPSDALEARAAADTAFTALLLGLGGVAVVVGGMGVANVMVMAVLERRAEIGLRRALGATRRHVGVQFLLEAVVLSGVGGVCGVGLGAGITAAYAARRGWPFALPPEGLAAAAGLALLVGAVAGLYAAVRAALLQPADAVRPH
ncbi:MAG TPA: ABC transporter permease [Euzebya sp.]|nr:ABC transporter permease [Euzebya sp.]